MQSCDDACAIEKTNRIDNSISHRISIINADAGAPACGNIACSCARPGARGVLLSKCVIFITTSRWAEAPIQIARMTLTIKLDRNWSSFQLANSAPPLSVTDSAIAPSARMQVYTVPRAPTNEHIARGALTASSAGCRMRG